MLAAVHMEGPGSVAYCDVDDCGEVAERVLENGRALCSTHRKQLQRTGRLTIVTERPESPRERLFLAALDLRDCDSEDDEKYALAERRFWAAFRAAARDLHCDPSSCVRLRALMSPAPRRIRRR